MDGLKYILEEESIRLADGLNAAGKERWESRQCHRSLAT